MVPAFLARVKTMAEVGRVEPVTWLPVRPAGSFSALGEFQIGKTSELLGLPCRNQARSYRELAAATAARYSTCLSQTVFPNWSFRICLYCPFPKMTARPAESSGIGLAFRVSSLRSIQVSLKVVVLGGMYIYTSPLL